MYYVSNIPLVAVDFEFDENRLSSSRKIKYFAMFIKEKCRLIGLYTTFDESLS